MNKTAIAMETSSTPLGFAGGPNSDINNNDVCDNEEVLGCTYAFAENYNPAATDDDGSCTVAECNPQGGIWLQLKEI